ncbi:vesicle-associated membrane protein 4 isoform X2 [Anabrus simplex]|uniref:vesicle-associated membrane protein 4 isoform X2 n=1 Tax=Anabrus simplex TaxID=316456 RepID=UPI0035A37453
MPPKFKRSLSQEDIMTAKRDETESLLEHKSGSEEDEGFFLNGPTMQSKANDAETDRIKQVRVQIAEVTEVMRSNVGKIVERGEHLEDLQHASDRLTAASVDFQSAATRMQRRAWAQHMKIRALIGITIVLILLCIIVPIIVHYS